VVEVVGGVVLREREIVDLLFLLRGRIWWR